MLNIRKQQMKTFSQAAIDAFENEMVAHCRSFSPRLSEVIGEEQLRVAVRQAIGRARVHGLINRGPVRLFIEMTLLFGSAFDTDPQYPWAAEILRDPKPGFQMYRAKRLHEKTLDYLKQVAGPEDQFTCWALERTSSLARGPMEFSSQDLVTDLLHRAVSIYPEKADYVGNEALESLFREGIDKAKSCGMVIARSQALFCILMLSFGHGCDDDPLYPWIARTLTDERIVDSEARAKRLEKKALHWLDSVISSFSK